MTRDGAIIVDDDPMTWADLVNRLGEVSAKAPDTMIILKADKDVSHGRVTAVLGLARSKGLNKLAIATEAEGELGGGE